MKSINDEIKKVENDMAKIRDTGVFVAGDHSYSILKMKLQTLKEVKKLLIEKDLKNNQIDGQPEWFNGVVMIKEILGEE